MSFRNRTNSFVEHVRGFMHRPAPHTKQSPIELGSLDDTDVLGSSLHKEAIGGSRRALKKVLLSAICVDYPNNRGQTPLFCACARDNEANALLLLQYGANPNEKCQEGSTPTHAACYVGNIHLLGKLIEAGGDLRLHDNDGNGVREWALRNPDPKNRSRMLQFLDKMHVCAMAYTGDAASADHFTRYVERGHKHTSVMELMKMRTGSDSAFENLKRVQSMGFGKVYLGGDFSGGIVSVVPLVSEALLTPTDNNMRFDTGVGTFVEQMKWAHMQVSVKKARPNVEPEDGIDNIISEAEFLGKLRHPNVVLLMGICQSTSLEDMWLIFELVEEATLHHFLHHSKFKLEFNRKWSIINHVCSAMEFIHHQNLIHCGLSSMAVYLVSPHTAKVGNFEFMVESIKADLGKASRVASVSHGTILYNWMAPELMREEAPHLSSDIYSFCCIVWELFAGEIPWAGLPAQDIYQKVVVESLPLNLNRASLPSKFKAIVGYGLELREEDRLHKFSLISHWLKSEEIPQFERSHSSLHWVNKSSNHVELTSSSSQSSSALSLSSKADSTATGTQDYWSQDRPHRNKRFISDFESPVNADFHHCREVNLSQYTPSEQKVKVSTYESEKDFPPQKPPRSFTYSHCSDTLRTTHHTSEDRASSQLSNKTSKCVTTSASAISESPRRTSLPVSPTRIKPASHSYSHGMASAEAQPTTSTSMFSEHTEQEEKPASSACTVREIAERYQRIQEQHKLRQAIIKGSMAPRGSCQQLRTSSEFIINDSLDFDGGVESALSSHGKQSCDVGSLSTTPVIRSSSTPKVGAAYTLMALSRSQHAVAACSPAPSAATKQPDKSKLSAERCPLDGGGRADNRAHNFPELIQESVGEAGVSQESHFQRRRALIDDIKQKHLLDKSPRTNDSSPGFQYSSPVLKFHSPDHRRLSEKLKLSFGAVEENPECKSSSRTEEHDEKVTKVVEDQALEVDSETPQSVLTGTYATVARRTSFEDDSFWAVTTLGLTEDKSFLEGSVAPQAEKDIFGLLHADFPGKDCRVIVKAEGLSLGTLYYHRGEQFQMSSTRPVANEDMAAAIRGIHSQVSQPKLSNCGPLGESPDSKTAQVNDQRMEPIVDDPQILAHNAQDSPGKGDRAAVKDETEEGVLDCLDGVKDIHNETFTLDLGLVEQVFALDKYLSQDSDKAIQWVDKELNKIKDGLRLNIGAENNHDSEAPPCSNATEKYSKQVTDNDFEFPEYYIDDDLNKLDPMQQLTQKDEHCERIPIIARAQPKLSPSNQSALKNNKTQDANPKEISTYRPKQETYSLASSCDSVASITKTFDHAPLLITETKLNAIENICQSAMFKNSELEDVRQRVLSRQSASDRDLSASRGVHLIAKSQTSSRGREGVPAKPGVKPSFASDGLRSGASDPSISTSLARGERGADASQQEATLAEDINFDDENTLMTISQDFDEPAAGGSCQLQEKDAETQISKAKLMPEQVVGKDQASQVEMETLGIKPYRVQPSDSVESDDWVKAKLGAIQRKIQRRKARPEYVASSDEDDQGWSPGEVLGQITLSATNTKSFQHLPKCLDLPKANRCKSLHNFGIHMDENYSKVMEELKVTSRARRRQIDDASKCNWRMEEVPDLKMKTKTAKPKQPSFITTSSVSQDGFAATSGSKESKINTGNDAADMHLYSDNRISKKSKMMRPKNFVKRDTSNDPESFLVSHHSTKSQQEDNHEDLSKRDHRGSVREKPSSCTILRKHSKENVAKYSSLPHSKPKPEKRNRVGQVPLLVTEDPSSDRFTDVSEVSTDLRYLLPSTSKQTENFPEQRLSSTVSSTERWLRSQNLRGNQDMGGRQTYKHADSERSSIKSGGRVLAETSRCSTVSGSKSGRPDARDTNSKHSVVSFSKVIETDRRSDSSRHSSRLGQRYRHEGPSKKSHSAAKLSPRSKKAGKARAQAEERARCASPSPVSAQPGRDGTRARPDELQVTVGLEQPHGRDETCKSKEQRKKNLGIHRFYIPREGWPDGYSTKLNVQVGTDSQRVTTTATNLASGRTETLLDQVVSASKLRSTIHMD